MTEHEDRVVCASCLGRLTGRSTERSSKMSALFGLVQAAFGLLVLWLFFLAVVAFLVLLALGKVPLP